MQRVEFDSRTIIRLSLMLKAIFSMTAADGGGYKIVLGGFTNRSVGLVNAELSSHRLIVNEGLP
jgi:hypothetical protein